MDSSSFDCRIRWIFILPGDPFISSYGFRSRVCVCLDLVTHHKERYTCTHYTPVLGENFLLTPLFNNPLSGVDDWNIPCGQSLSCVYFFGHSWPYLLVRLALAHPMMSLADQVSMLFNLGVWMSQGTFRLSLATGISVWSHNQIFFVLPTSSTTT